jgi:protein lysine acetyltransferase
MGVTSTAMLTRLTDGTRLLIRTIRPDDKELLVRGLGLLSEETRRRRFMSAKPRLTAAELRYLTEIDGEAHHALVAVLADRPTHVVAVARYVRLPDDPTTADAAIVVGDPWQHKGLGRRLAIMLADAASVHGIRRFSAAMLSDNPVPLALMRTLTARLESPGPDQGVREVVADLAA